MLYSYACSYIATRVAIKLAMRLEWRVTLSTFPINSNLVSQDHLSDHLAVMAEFRLKGTP